MPTNRELLLDAGTALDLEALALPASRLESLLADAPGLASELLDAADEESADAPLVYRSVTAVIAKALRDHDQDLLSKGIDSLSEIWRLGDVRAMLSTTTPSFEASLWEALAFELYALGALAVLYEQWGQVRQLTRQRPDPTSLRESWLRQGQVASSRASSYPEETILFLAKPRLIEFDPDLSDDDAVAALCQFDLLSGLIIGETDERGFYPNAAEFSAERVERLVVEQLRIDSSPLRSQVYPGDKDGLREALRTYNHKACTQAAYARYAGRDWQWRAFADARTWSWIDEGHLLEEWM
jgi:hypothetical protein